MNSTNHDLLPSPKNPGPLDASRVWTICELLCYRFRDEVKSDFAKRQYHELAAEIFELRREWEKWESHR